MDRVSAQRWREPGDRAAPPHRTALPVEQRGERRHARGGVGVVGTDQPLPDLDRAAGVRLALGKTPARSRPPKLWKRVAASGWSRLVVLDVMCSARRYAASAASKRPSYLP